MQYIKREDDGEIRIGDIIYLNSPVQSINLLTLKDNLQSTFERLMVRMQETSSQQRGSGWSLYSLKELRVPIIRRTIRLRSIYGQDTESLAPEKTNALVYDMLDSEADVDDEWTENDIDFIVNDEDNESDSLDFYRSVDNILNNEKSNIDELYPGESSQGSCSNSKKRKRINKKKKRKKELEEPKVPNEIDPQMFSGKNNHCFLDCILFSILYHFMKYDPETNLWCYNCLLYTSDAADE